MDYALTNSRDDAADGPVSGEIDAEVKRGLDQFRGDWPVLAESAGVSHSWLSKFFNGHIPNPGLTTLKKVRAVIRDHAAQRGATH